MLTPALLLFLLYLALIGNYTYHWFKIPVFKKSAAKHHRLFTILIPARNEASNITGLLSALERQNYPADLIEIIVIDDQSTDETADIVRKFQQVRLIQKNGSEGKGKKKSLELGIEAANHNWIITTDADCKPGAEWISTINAFLDTQDSICVVGPVTVSSNQGTLLEEFQRYDNLMFQGITGAAIQSSLHTLGNGANLCYRKDCFEAVGGFRGIDGYASGDDVLLIEKFMSNYPGRVRFLKSDAAIIKTQAATSWEALWQQRIRWVSKTPAYKQIKLQAAQWVTGLFNLALLIQTIYCIVDPSDWKVTLTLWLFKALIEWPLVRSVATLYQERTSFVVYLLMQPLHVIYLVSIGLFGRQRTYEWKGRMVR